MGGSSIASGIFLGVTSQREREMRADRLSLIRVGFKIVIIYILEWVYFVQNTFIFLFDNRWKCHQCALFRDFLQEDCPYQCVWSSLVVYIKFTKNCHSGKIFLLTLDNAFSPDVYMIRKIMFMNLCLCVLLKVSS